MKTAYDVIVAGAGPAGSVAARRAAEQGFDVLLLEKRQEIGAPVRCAEAIGAEATRPFIEPDPRWIDAEVFTWDVHSPAGAVVRLPWTETTLVVNRKVFDVELALRAARAGAEVRTSARVTGLLHENGAVAGVQVEHLGRLYSIHARLVVAADGTESQVARWAGLKTVPPLADYYVSLQFLLSGLGGAVERTTCQYHLGHALAPGGYGWAFPKGDDVANVGLVLSGDQAAGGAVQAHLERFVERRFPRASIVGVVAGGIPVTGALEHMVTDGLLVVGDAAHQADPLFGGGINLAMTGADLAMQVAVPALRAGDVSAARLQAYERLWRERFGKMHEAMYRIRKIMAGIDDARLDALVAKAATLPLQSMSLGSILVTLLKSQPMLLLEARKLITAGLVLK